MNQATVIETQVQPDITNVSLTTEALERIKNMPAPYKVNDKMVEVDALRKQALADDITYGAPGRNAMRASMDKVYALYVDVQANPASNMIKDRMVHLLENQTPPVKLRANSKPASVFIRYVFADLSDKQVHVYATALEVAEKNKVTPTAFLSMVDLAGGWEGVRADAASPEMTAEQRANLALNLVKSASAAETVKADTWGDAEELRVFIAVNNKDGTADIKDLRLSEENIKAVLATYQRDIKQRNKAKVTPKRVLSDDKKAALFNLKADLSYQEQMCQEYSSNYQRELSRDLTKAEEARALYTTAQFRVKGLKAAIRAFKKD